MGGEFGQWNEWNHDGSLDWELLKFPLHMGLQRWVEDLNRAYRSEGALHRKDFDPRGFEWIDCNDSDNSILSYIRRSELQEGTIMVVCNFTPVPQHNYRIGVDFPGFWKYQNRWL